MIGSEFNAANTISWLTTSYLVTSTAFQPLYGRFSDILGRRACFFTATLTFLVGCLGCALAPDLVSLNLMRALTGLGGGGLMTMATIINSDMIPFRERGMYQACQNVLHGFGSICGASLGGVIADTIGWRWCFMCQVPVSAFACVVGYFVVKDLHTSTFLENDQEGLIKPKTSTWKQIDLSGSLLLVLGLSAQLAALSMGGNNYPWSDIRVIASLAISVVLLAAFVAVESRTEAIPVMPMSMLRGTLAISNQISNVCVGMAAYAVSIKPPLRNLITDTLLVPLHTAVIFPSCAPRYSFGSRDASCYPIFRHPSWRSSRWLHHVALWPIERTSENWLFLHDTWECSSCIFQIP